VEETRVVREKGFLRVNYSQALRRKAGTHLDGGQSSLGAPHGESHDEGRRVVVSLGDVNKTIGDESKSLLPLQNRNNE
jgi:hypothetical protein